MVCTIIEKGFKWLKRVVLGNKFKINRKYLIYDGH
jgi:hypothetical protein